MRLKRSTSRRPPGLIVIDRKGIMRYYHEGAVPTLAAGLSESINALLAEAK